MRQLRRAKNGLTVTIIEAHEAGGTCLNCGCIPTKTLCRNAEAIETLANAETFGIDVSGFQLNFNKVIERKREVVEKLRSGIETLMQMPGITFVRGFAHFTDAKTIAVGNETYTADGLAQTLGYIAIKHRKTLFHELNDRNFAAKAVEDRGKFHSYYT